MLRRDFLRGLLLGVPTVLLWPWHRSPLNVAGWRCGCRVDGYQRSPYWIDDFGITHVQSSFVMVCCGKMPGHHVALPKIEGERGWRIIKADYDISPDGKRIDVKREYVATYEPLPPAGEPIHV